MDTLANAERALEDWLIDHRWSNAYNLAATITASDWLADLLAAARREGVDAALAPVEAMVKAWPTGDNGQDYRAAVTQCAAAVRDAIALGRDAAS